MVKENKPLNLYEPWAKKREAPYYISGPSKDQPYIMWSVSTKRRSSEIPMPEEKKSIIKTILKPLIYLWNHL